MKQLCIILLVLCCVCDNGMGVNVDPIVGKWENGYSTVVVDFYSNNRLTVRRKLIAEESGVWYTEGAILFIDYDNFVETVSAKYHIDMDTLFLYHKNNDVEILFKK